MGKNNITEKYVFDKGLICRIYEEPKDSTPKWINTNKKMTENEKYI